MSDRRDRDTSCRARPLVSCCLARRTHAGLSFDVTAIEWPSNPPPSEDKESAMRDGRLTFSLRGGRTMIIIGLTPSRSENASLSLVHRPREIVWKPAPLRTCVSVVDFSGSTISSRDDNERRGYRSRGIKPAER